MLVIVNICICMQSRKAQMRDIHNNEPPPQRRICTKYTISYHYAYQLLRFDFSLVSNAIRKAQQNTKTPCKEAYSRLKRCTVSQSSLAHVDDHLTIR